MPRNNTKNTAEEAENAEEVQRVLTKKGTRQIPVPHYWQFKPFSRTLSLTSHNSYIDDDARSTNSSLSDATLCCRGARRVRVPINIAALRYLERSGCE